MIISEKTLSELILEVLEEKRMTIFEISELIGYQENSIRTAVYRLKENGLIRETGHFKRKYKIYEVPDDPYSNKSKEQIEREIIERLTEGLLNTGKRQTIFDFFEHQPENLQDESNDVKIGYFLQKLITIAKEELAKDESFKQEIFEELKEKLVKKYDLTPKS